VHCGAGERGDDRVYRRLPPGAGGRCPGRVPGGRRGRAPGGGTARPGKRRRIPPPVRRAERLCAGLAAGAEGEHPIRPGRSPPGTDERAHRRALPRGGGHEGRGGDQRRRHRGADPAFFGGDAVWRSGALWARRGGFYGGADPDRCDDEFVRAGGGAGKPWQQPAKHVCSGQPGAGCAGRGPGGGRGNGRQGHCLFGRGVRGGALFLRGRGDPARDHAGGAGKRDRGRCGQERLWEIDPAQAADALLGPPARGGEAVGREDTGGEHGQPAPGRELCDPGHTPVPRQH